jgi:hypothetical protein
MPLKGPQLLDEPIVRSRPLALQELDDRSPPCKEFRAIAPVLSGEYASDTLAGSRAFQASSARRTRHGGFGVEWRQWGARGRLAVLFRLDHRTVGWSTKWGHVATAVLQRTSDDVVMQPPCRVHHIQSPPEFVFESRVDRPTPTPTPLRQLAPYARADARKAFCNWPTR